MNRIRFARFCGFILLISNFQIIPKTIHILGDSHASFCFREDKFLKPFEAFDLPVTFSNKKFKLPFRIHWLGPITMHRVGRDGLQFLDIKKLGVQEEDIALFLFGEIDVRCHIGKQRDEKKRNLSEIIESLAQNYITTIQENQKNFKALTVIVCSIAPPIDGINRMNPEYPFYGTLADRVAITRSLNKKLQKLCVINNFLFLDVYDLYADSQGALNLQFADPTVHIDYIYNLPIKRKLIELIAHLL